MNKTITKLKQPICKKCINESGMTPWNESDDSRWGKGYVACGGWEPAAVNQIPPHCLYSLEHLTQQEL